MIKIRLIGLDGETHGEGLVSPDISNYTLVERRSRKYVYSHTIFGEIPLTMIYHETKQPYCITEF